MRERLATRLRKDPTDVFGLLKEVGRDCAGAVQIVPEGEALNHESTEDVEWLTERELALTLDELSDRPLADDPARGIRISLAGAQDKLVVVFRDDRFGLPRAATPSSRILKPPSTVRRGRRGDRLAYPDLVANEAFCMSLGAMTGFAVAKTEVLPIEGEPTLLIERYDRTLEDGRLRRIHQEDFCQALGVPSRLKYEQDGGPGTRAFLELIDRWSVDVASDRDALIGRIAFNFLIGNADAHAKNYSLLHSADGIRLAPAYDLVSTAVYPHLATEMATSIRGVFDPAAVEPEHFRQWIADLGLSATYFPPLVAALAASTKAALEPVLKKTIERLGGDVPLLHRIAAIVTARADLLAKLG